MESPAIGFGFRDMDPETGGPVLRSYDCDAIHIFTVDGACDREGDYGKCGSYTEN